jgi:hypothetical protein
MKLTDVQLLAGQKEEITICDLRNRPGDVFQQVQMGKTFYITKNGKLIAEIKDPEKLFDWGALAALRKTSGGY